MFSRPRGRVWAAGLSLAALATLVLSACGGTGGTGTGPAQGTQVAGGAKATAVVDCSKVDASTFHLVTPNELTIASDTTYAPAEFVDPNNPNVFDGYDMDLVRELARRLCVGPHIVTASFDSIIADISGPPLGQQPWDLSISSFTIKPSRAQVVDMIPYFVAGESTLVAKGNPQSIKGISDMCGKVVAVQNGTVEKDELSDANGTGDGSSGQAPTCKQAGKVIQILSFDSEEDVINQVVNGRAVAAYQDQPVTDYYISLHPGQLDKGYITPDSTATQGIVVRKDNPALETAIKTALDAMVKDGTYQRIMAAWGQTSLACLPNCPAPLTQG